MITTNSIPKVKDKADSLIQKKNQEIADLNEKLTFVYEALEAVNANLLAIEYDTEAREFTLTLSY